MQVRKLVKSGYASLVTAIPREWIKKNCLKAGDLLYITEEADSLKITADVRKRPVDDRELVIQIDGKDMLTVQFEITAAYLNNYHRIIIKGKELPKVNKHIKQLISSHVALELIDESSDRIVARDFLNLHDVDLKLIVRRMDNIVRSMMSDTKEALTNPDIVSNIIDRDPEVNRLNFMIFKILKAAFANKELLSSIGIREIDILRYWQLNIDVEKAADRVKNIAEIVPHLSGARKKRFSELFAKLESSYHDAMKAFYQASVPLADTIAKKRNSMINDIQNYIRKNDCVICSQIAINMFNLAANINDIARIVRYLQDD